MFKKLLSRFKRIGMNNATENLAAGAIFFAMGLPAVSIFGAIFGMSFVLTILGLAVILPTLLVAVAMTKAYSEETAEIYRSLEFCSSAEKGSEAKEAWSIVEDIKELAPLGSTDEKVTGEALVLMKWIINAEAKSEEIQEANQKLLKYASSDDDHAKVKQLQALVTNYNDRIDETIEELKESYRLLARNQIDNMEMDVTEECKIDDDERLELLQKGAYLRQGYKTIDAEKV